MAVHAMAPMVEHPQCIDEHMPLSLVSSGKQVKVLQIRGGKKFTARLRDLGLNQNATIRIIKNDLTGPLIIAVKNDGRLAIGRGQAGRILVSIPKF